MAFTLPAPKTSISETERCVQVIYVFSSLQLFCVIVMDKTLCL